MLSKDAFIEFILKGPQSATVVAAKPEETALPTGFEDFGFDTDATTASVDQANSSFARRLLEASGFGYAELVQRDSVIRSSDAVARYLPTRAAYWPKTAARPYQPVLFEADLNNKDLLAIPAFRHQKMFHLDIVEDALSRFVEEALKGFQKGGQDVTADVRQGRPEETLCVISILDQCDGEPVRLVCFGTQNEQTGGLETFRITEQTRLWEPQIAREHLGLLYERQFKKLTGPHWQEAFTTTEERKHAERLLAICTGAPTERDIQEGILTLLDTIAKGFGLRRRTGQQRRLQAFDLPRDHDIGIDPEQREAQHGGRNPFGGIALRDERNRLLGYIVYPLKTQADADRLRTYLRQNNRFHNVLVVYPGADQAALELWQGQEQLTGKLRKGQGYRDAAEVVNLLSRFFVVSKAKVHNPAELAQELAYRARYLRRLAVKQLEEEPETGHLRDLYNAFKEAMVHDQTEDEFADAYAQTLTYGLLSARWVAKDEYVSSGERFTRENALNHMPATSPFLREFFETVLKASFEFKLTWLMDDIAALLDRIDIDMIFNRGTLEADWTTDPVIYFYEPFLQAYDARIRKARGVYYTPQPVVSYIVRSVDELLHTEFGLQDGLADTTTWDEMVKRHGDIKIPDGAKPGDTFVQILDPATGTGTFLVEVIDVIHQTLTQKWQGEGLDGKKIKQLWNDYVSRHLLPRLHGYELLMAPYVIAHMKIGLKLRATGYCFRNYERVRVFLTDSLEPTQDFSDRLVFAIPSLAHEAEAVNGVKRHNRFTVLMGNPPYSVKSANAGEWITEMVRDQYYPRDQIKEQNPKLLLDDYVKFVRFGQDKIMAANHGILSLITNHGYLDNPTFRQMRLSLKKSFEKLYFVNLHGNTKRRERCPDGSVDENVFEIQQGVAIGTFLIGPLAKEGLCGQIWYSDCWGKQVEKYNWLKCHGPRSVEWTKLSPAIPFHLFVPHDLNAYQEYAYGIRLVDMMPINSTGVKTHRDAFAYDISDADLRKRINEFRDMCITNEEIAVKYKLRDTRDWKLKVRRESLANYSDWEAYFTKCLYRPFDHRFYYSHADVVELPRNDVMQHLLKNTNLALCTNRQVVNEFRHAFCTRYAADNCGVSLETRERTYVFPLYLYAEKNRLFGGLSQWKASESSSVPNLDRDIVQTIQSLVGLRFSPSGDDIDSTAFGPEDVFHYICAILHSPIYRSRYSKFLQSDFPRIPLTSDTMLFRGLAAKGADLVALHLLEDDYKAASWRPNHGPLENTQIISLVAKEKLEVAKGYPKYKSGKVFINSHCYFQGVPEEVWNFRIGGYQVCEKWLKDRQAKGGKNPRPGRILTDDDIAHYQKIVVALNETIRIMQEIDDVINQHGGWPDAFVTKDGDNA